MVKGGMFDWLNTSLSWCKGWCTQKRNLTSYAMNQRHHFIHIDSYTMWMYICLKWLRARHIIEPLRSVTTYNANDNVNDNNNGSDSDKANDN